MFKDLKFYLKNPDRFPKPSQVRDIFNGVSFAGTATRGLGYIGVLLTSVSHLAFNTSSDPIRTAIALTASGIAAGAIGRITRRLTAEPANDTKPWLIGVAVGIGSIALGTNVLAESWNQAVSGGKQSVSLSAPRVISVANLITAPR